uniref:Uncharacterized protein n=1 Tax=Siphoviridae sp. ctmP19 TaxID=2825651 RepID=A0A8S5PH09_9CAUD|nr:MAG TPA: hypothetical protein [Siphoviridae sp. ctmP19]
MIISVRYHLTQTNVPLRVQTQLYTVINTNTHGVTTAI